MTTGERHGRQVKTAGSWLLAGAGRMPFTFGTALLILALGLTVGGLWSPTADKPWYPNVAYGLPSFEEGRWWTLATGALLGEQPVAYAAILFGFVLLVGFAEFRMGTLWAAVLTCAGQALAVLLAALILLALRPTGWGWALNLSYQRDVGFSAGTLLIGAMAAATLRSPWRLRLQLGLVGYVAVSLLFVGSISDLEHTIAVASGLLASRWIHVPGRVPASGRLSRREWRLLAVTALVFIAIVPVIVWLAPNEGPLGSTYGLAGPGWELAVGLAIVAPLINGLRRGHRRAWWWTRLIAFVYVALGLVVAIVFAVAKLMGGKVEFIGGAVLFPSAVAWVVELIILTRGRDAFHVPSPRSLRRRTVGAVADPSAPEQQKAVTLLMQHGGGNLSWMTTWPDNSYFFSSSGQCYVAYRAHAGVAVALSDPVGALAARPDAVLEFADQCDGMGLIPCFFSATEQVARAAETLGWRNVQVAEDTVIDLQQLEFRGKSWQDVRTALNRARKEGIVYRLVTLADEPRAVVGHVHALSEQWVGDMGLPEMGFTLGGVEEAMDPHVLVGIAQDLSGTIHGITSWLPVYGGGAKVRGWTLDVMRRRQGGFRPVVEFLIASSCLAFQEREAEFASLSGAPLARVEQSGRPGILEGVLERLGRQMEPYYGFRSLHAFKTKFQPRYDPMYLIYRDEADLPRIGIALARAYMPDVGPRDLMSVLARPKP